MDQFVIAKQLGGGYASTVHLAICKATGIQVAIKVYHRCKLSQLNNYQVQREIRIHSCLAHPYIVQLVSSIRHRIQQPLVSGSLLLAVIETCVAILCLMPGKENISVPTW